MKCMKIYLIDNLNDAIWVRRLIHVEGQNQNLKWSRELKAPKDVRLAAQTVMDFCKDKIYQFLDECEIFSELTENEEDILESSLKKSEILKQYLGTSCVLSNSELKITLSELKQMKVCPTIQKALETGKNIVIY